MAKQKNIERSARAAYGRMWRDWMRPHKWILWFTVLLMAIVAAASAGYAKFIEYVIEAFTVGDASVAIWGPLGVIALTVTRGLSQYSRTIIQNKVLSRVQSDMQDKMFESLVNMDLRHLLAEAPAALASRFSSDIELARQATLDLFVGMTAVFTLIATFAVMLSIDWAMSLGLILIFALAFGPVGMIGTRVRRISTQTQKEIAGMTESVNEGLAGIRMVRTYQLEDRMLRNAHSVFQSLYRLRVSLVKWQSTVSPLLEIAAGLAVAALLYLVDWRMRSGALDLAGFLGLLTALGVATNPAQKMGNTYSRALQGVAALERIFNLFDAKNVIRDGDFKYPKGEKAAGRITFENVGFLYPDGYEALKGINLVIEPGQTFAFVGRSGAGKTTIFNLLPRLFDATEGAIKLDGRDIRDFTLSSLRDQISVVSQDSILLKGTVLENIAFGRPDATRQECIDAAKAAAADGFINNLKDGYDTLIDPSRSAFSGGERQRLSIARAILRNAPILLLDEPTSALDAESEASIRDALERLSEGRTTLVIAHRLSTIMHADQIVVLDKGVIKDLGTHEDLLKKQGIYADLYNLQFNMAPTRPRNPRPRSFASNGKWTSPLEFLAKRLGL